MQLDSKMLTQRDVLIGVAGRREEAKKRAEAETPRDSETQHDISTTYGKD